ncbi:hypothetical protein M3Y99_00849100 [Aphelenchoides fujianensis]|nr:hypothetical protein M3Y99_00849100 [Aphelenchoides fujianensis]
METFLFDHERYERFYNCSFYSVDSIPLEDRRHEYWGVFFLTFYAIGFSSYLVCLGAMLASEKRKEASIQLMFLLGCIHCIGLQTSGLLVGIWTIQGAVFCSHPTVSYVVGCICSWCASTLTSQILGINRCLMLFNRSFAEYAFSGWRRVVWMSLPFFFFVYLCGWTAPPVFSSLLMAYVFNAHVGYSNDYGAVYKNLPNTVNNLLVCGTELLICGSLIVLYLRATRSSSHEERKAADRDKRFYIQVLLVGIIHFIASLTYVLIQFFPVTNHKEVIIMASTFYLFSQGAPPLIYITVNQTLRNQILKSWRHGKRAVCGRSAVGSSIVATSATQPNGGPHGMEPVDQPATSQPRREIRDAVS